jgi:hypothetical protein
MGEMGAMGGEMGGGMGGGSSGGISAEAGLGGGAGMSLIGGSANGGAVAAGAGGVSAGLHICVRLDSPTKLSFEVTKLYELKVYDDCRINWVSGLYLAIDERVEFLNNLVAWNMALWGCSTPAPTDFRLIHVSTELTTADAALLVNHYLDAAQQKLSMGAAEISEMRSALEKLSAPLTIASTKFSHPNCVNNGGAGGSSGNAGSAGASGAATGGGGGGASGSSNVGGAGGESGASHAAGAGGVTGDSGAAGANEGGSAEVEG